MALHDQTHISDTRTHEERAGRAGTLGLALFLVSLSVLFAASMLAYLLVRVGGRQAPPLHTLAVPGVFWLSTVLMLAGTLAIHRAVGAVRADRRSAFRTAMIVTLLLALAFLAVQGPGLYRLYQAHEAARADNVFLYGLALLLIALHAAHVIGGVIPLALVTRGALRGRYSPADHRAVRHCATYWHFLDGVWLLMFAMLLATG